MSSWVYILTNTHHTTLYIGVTSNLPQRLEQHRIGKADGFTKRYNLHKLVYAEPHDDITLAIQREKALKGSSRARKLKLIEAQNPSWNDLTPLLQ